MGEEVLQGPPWDTLSWSVLSWSAMSDRDTGFVAFAVVAMLLLLAACFVQKG